MIFLNKKYPGLRMVLEPKRSSELGKRSMDKGNYIDFEKGKYQTKDPKEIAKIKEYMDKHQGEITMIDEKEVEREKRIQKKARELIEEEDRKAAAAGKSVHDVHGKEINKGPLPKTDGFGKEITDEEIEAADISKKDVKIEDMTIVQLLKLAKTLGMTLNKKMKKVRMIKIIGKALKKANAKAAQNEKEPDDVDLTDESNNPDEK